MSLPPGPVRVRLAQRIDGEDSDWTPWLVAPDWGYTLRIETDYTSRLAFVIPAAHVATFRALMAEIGAANAAGVSVALSANGEAPATHWGASVAAGPGMTMLIALRGQDLQDALTNVESALALADVEACFAAIVWSEAGHQADARAQFDALLTAESLQWIT